MFRPTYLYVKTHKKTGLKYFGKTVCKDPCRYKGSGSRWLNHLKKHGSSYRDIDTMIIGYYADETECRNAALSFSYENSIVESNDWANLEVEDGIEGGQGGNAGARNGSFGTKWVTNGAENRKILKEDPVPEGWRPGMVVSKDWGEKLSKAQKGNRSPLKGRTLEQIHGAEKATQLRQNLSAVAKQREEKHFGRNAK